MAKRKKKESFPLLDGGLGPKERKRLRTAVREAWFWTSHARRLVIKRCLREGGFSECELCHAIVPKIAVDHIVPCGFFDYGFIERCFAPSSKMQGLCTKCHGKKTRQEKKLIDRIVTTDDF